MSSSHGSKSNWIWWIAGGAALYLVFHFEKRNIADLVESGMAQKMRLVMANPQGRAAMMAQYNAASPATRAEYDHFFATQGIQKTW